MEPDELSGTPLVWEPFDKKRHDRNTFSCEVKSLWEYLKSQASQDMKRKAAVVFVLAAGSTIVGYYTLSSYTIDAGELPAELHHLPKYPKLPATLIGRLARDESRKGKGISELLLVDALRRCLNATSTVGSVVVVVEAENDKARAFYLHHGFIQFPSRPSKLFMTMKDIEATFSEEEA